MTIYCKICGHRSVSNYGEVCIYCRNEQQEAHNATLRQAEAAEEAAEYQRQAADDAAEARRLAAEVHYNCYHCGGSFAKSTGYAPSETEIGKPLCSDCYNLVKKCYGCGKILFKGSDDCKQLVTIYHRKKETKQIIPHDDFFACKQCISNNLGKDQKWFDIQKQREKEYEDQQAEERRKQAIREQEEEIKRQERRRKEELIQQEEEKLALKQQLKNDASLIFAPILFVIMVVIESVVYDAGWTIVGVSALGLIISCFAFPKIICWIGRTVTIALILELAFGVLISVICWFKIDAFVKPLTMCAIFFFILALVLEITGLSRKYVDNESIADILKSVPIIKYLIKN